MMRYHSLYHDFCGTDMNWAIKAGSLFQNNSWDSETPFLFDGHNWNETICEEAVGHILKSLSFNTSAINIIIRNVRIGQDAEEALSNAFHNHSQVQSMIISNLIQDSNSLPIILPASIFKIRSLIELTLENCILDEDACLEFANLICDDECKIRSLSLKDVIFDELSLDNLSNAIALNTSIDYVTWKGIQDLSITGFNKLLFAFAASRNVQHIVLDEMNLKETHCHSIAQFLKMNSNVEILSLRRNDLNAAAIKIITDGIAYNTTLTTLYLSENSFGDDGTIPIVEALTVNKTLQDLCLKNCSIQHEGCRIIAKGLASFIGLKHLNMEMNKIERCCEELLQSLEQNCTIHTILRDNIRQTIYNQNEIKEWKHIERYIRLNRLNRKAMKELECLTPSLTTHFLAKPKIGQDPDILFHFVSNLSTIYLHYTS